MSENQSGQNPEIEKIITQYRKVVGSFENMFQVMRPRMAEEPWRLDGIGSCCIGKDESEEGFKSSIVYEEIIKLREVRNDQSRGIRYDETEACPYHRADQGCVLGDLKGPRCIRWVDSPWEIDKRFGFSGSYLMRYISRVLETILDGQGTVELVESACEYAATKAQYVAQFPVLTPAEIERSIMFLGGIGELGHSVIKEYNRGQWLID